MYMELLISQLVECGIDKLAIERYICLFIILLGFLLFINSITEFKRDYNETYFFNKKKLILSIIMVIGSIITLVTFNTIYSL